MAIGRRVSTQECKFTQRVRDMRIQTDLAGRCIRSRFNYSLYNAASISVFLEWFYYHLSVETVIWARKLYCGLDGW